MNTKRKLQWLEAQLAALPAPEPPPADWEPEEELAASAEEPWEDRQNDPDNWLVIPEFGVLPQAVNFEGFASPIVGPDDSQAGWRGSIRRTVHAVRDEARRRFASLQALHDAGERVLMASDLAGRADQWIADGAFAFHYSTFFWHLQQAHRKHRLGQAEPCIDQLARALGMVAFIHAGDQARLANFFRLRSKRKSKSADLRHAQDPKHHAKGKVKKRWEEWQLNPTKYSSAEQFARDMLDEFTVLQSSQVITRWCRVWKGKANGQQPRRSAG
ncbi:hypothetical protein [Ramlibacter sp.]|uniref:hypothetical protein n=1 Tax=Ramlibacter sp. TaxID=1917967 RepID=UPI002D75CBD6|nr:hypothetical protein [Ramlibacter sp.]HYD75330.1 hypothetical protein [Ramlibacter sp.]